MTASRLTSASASKLAFRLQQGGLSVHLVAHMTLRLLLLVTASLPLLLLSSCSTAMSSQAMTAQSVAREAQIAAEPRGDFWIGRRFHIERTHMWGYLRRPGQGWDKSKLVVMGERQGRQPDRFPEDERAERRYGFDHNFEYRIWGNYTGRRVYDPNSNLVLPEFAIQRYELLNTQAGWLFKPGERFTGNQLLRREEGADP
jgi:hypothetical protein